METEEQKLVAEYRKILEEVSTITILIDQSGKMTAILSDVVWWQGPDSYPNQPIGHSYELYYGCTLKELAEAKALKNILVQIQGPYTGPNPFLYNPSTKRFSCWDTNNSNWYHSHTKPDYW